MKIVKIPNGKNENYKMKMVKMPNSKKENSKNAKW